MLGLLFHKKSKYKVVTYIVSVDIVVAVVDDDDDVVGGKHAASGESVPVGVPVPVDVTLLTGTAYLTPSRHPCWVCCSTTTSKSLVVECFE
jgi:hypothetical protein